MVGISSMFCVVGSNGVVQTAEIPMNSIQLMDPEASLKAANNDKSLTPQTNCKWWIQPILTAYFRCQVAANNEFIMIAGGSNYFSGSGQLHLPLFLIHLLLSPHFA